MASGQNSLKRLCPYSASWVCRTVSPGCHDRHGWKHGTEKDGRGKEQQMVDFHSHFLPGIDDGSDSVETSLSMLRESRKQGVKLMCATPHFYADEVDPAYFLKRRNDAWDRLRTAMQETGEEWPEIRLGAEVLYFPGMSAAEEVAGLRLQGTPFLLVEPPMMPWSNAMLDEVEQCGPELNCVPVIAHIDRYMRLLNDYTLFERVEDRNLLIQVNANFFLSPKTKKMAVRCLEDRKIHFIGSDCHNMRDRLPNMGDAEQAACQAGVGELFHRLNEHVKGILLR